MCLFMLLPAGFAALSLAGHSSQANRYWTMVLAADLGAFAPLSVFQTRPPWVLEGPAGVARAVRFAAWPCGWCGHATIRVNTFPSGHAAVSLALALAVVGSMPATGAVLLLLSATVSLACIVGRYHYVVDVVAGVVLALRRLAGRRRFRHLTCFVRRIN